MEERREPALEAQGSDRSPARARQADAAFRSHLAIYLVTGLFLLSLNLLTDPGELWFYWPMFFWGWALIFHAVGVYGTDAPWRVADVLRSMVPGSRSAGTAPDAPRPTRYGAHAAAAQATSLSVVDDRVRRLWRTARQIPDGAVRDQAFRIAAGPYHIAEVMALDHTDERTVAWFNERLLEPTESLLAGYLRLASRGVTGADATLRRVAEQNLPLIETRLDTLYDQLHRGDVVDLAVASEMLELGLPDAPPRRVTR